MKIQLRFLLLFICLLFSRSSVQACELYWYLAASMSKPAKVIVRQYNAQTDDCHVYLIVGGSGQLLNKLRLSQKGDLYTPASESFLNRAKQSKLVKEHKRLLRQTPVFGISQSASNKIKTFEDLLTPGVKIALGNPGTMALGKTYQKLESKMPSEIRGKIKANTLLNAINVNQIVNYLLSNTVDAGITFDTTARANGIKQISIPSQYNISTQSYLAILNTTDAYPEAKKFQTYVLNQKQVFQKFGFSLAN